MDKAAMLRKVPAKTKAHDAAQKARLRRNEIVLGVDGKKVSPRSFDVLPTLRFVQTWMALVEAIASSQGKDLSFTGLDLRKGSAAFAFSSQDPELAASSSAQAHLYLVGEKEPPHGLRTRVSDLKDSIRRIPHDYTLYVEQGKVRDELPREFPEKDLYQEMTTVRGEIIDAGGVRPPHVRLASSSKILFLSTDRDNARKAGQCLYRQVDATVTLFWDGEQFVRGVLHDFDGVEPLSSTEEISRWREWFAEAGRDWNSVSDIEAELGRETEEPNL